jgi:hypothetical protein
MQSAGYLLPIWYFTLVNKLFIFKFPEILVVKFSEPFSRFVVKKQNVRMICQLGLYAVTFTDLTGSTPSETSSSKMTCGRIEETNI